MVVPGYLYYTTTLELGIIRVLNLLTGNLLDN